MAKHAEIIKKFMKSLDTNAVNSVIKTCLQLDGMKSFIEKLISNIKGTPNEKALTDFWRKKFGIILDNNDTAAITDSDEDDSETESYGDNFSFNSNKPFYMIFRDAKLEYLRKRRGNLIWSQKSMDDMIALFNYHNCRRALNEIINGKKIFDHTLAHEFAHAIARENVDYYDYLPAFVKKGIATLPSYTNRSNVYTGSYMFLRYLADKGTTSPATRTHVFDRSKVNDMIPKNASSTVIYTLGGNNSTIKPSRGITATLYGSARQNNISPKSSCHQHIMIYKTGDESDKICTTYDSTDTINIVGGYYTTKCGNRSCTNKYGNTTSGIISRDIVRITVNNPVGKKIFIIGSGGTDTIYGNRSCPNKRSDTESDKLYGGTVRDILYGDCSCPNKYNDTIRETIHGNTVRETVYGNTSIEKPYKNTTSDIISRYTTGDKIYKDTVRITVNNPVGKKNIISGSDKSDILYGRNDNDLKGGKGSEVFWGNGDEVFFYQDDSDIIFGYELDDISQSSGNSAKSTKSHNTSKGKFVLKSVQQPKQARAPTSTRQPSTSTTTPIK